MYDPVIVRCAVAQSLPTPLFAASHGTTAFYDLTHLAVDPTTAANAGCSTMTTFTPACWAARMVRFAGSPSVTITSISVSAATFRRYTRSSLLASMHTMIPVGRGDAGALGRCLGAVVVGHAPLGIDLGHAHDVGGRCCTHPGATERFRVRSRPTSPGRSSPPVRNTGGVGFVDQIHGHEDRPGVTTVSPSPRPRIALATANAVLPRVEHHACEPGVSEQVGGSVRSDVLLLVGLRQHP